MNDRRLLHASLNDAMRELDRLKNPQALPPATAWSWQGPLRPHFAYGKLSKPEFERAHAMHLANHFSAFDITA